MATTPLGFKYPAGTDPVQVPLHLQQLAQSVDTYVTNNVVGAWQPYTVTLTASTTNPTLGAGGYTRGRYMRVGKTVHYQTMVYMGTTGFLPGSGVWNISVPVTPENTGGLWDSQQCGIATLSDTSAGITTVRSHRYTGVMGIGDFVTPTTPWAWASGDFISISGTYPTA